MRCSRPRVTLAACTRHWATRWPRGRTGRSCGFSQRTSRWMTPKPANANLDSSPPREALEHGSCDRRVALMRPNLWLTASVHSARASSAETRSKRACSDVRRFDRGRRSIPEAISASTGCGMATSAGAVAASRSMRVPRRSKHDGPAPAPDADLSTIDTERLRYQTLISSLLHKYASGRLKKV